jgi:DNA invertase Pin-like site-specific DNA recombinase
MRWGYGRVSSRDQHLDVQEQRLAACCDKVLLETGSGTSMQKRPKLHMLLELLGDKDVLVVCKLDRLARSILDLHHIAEQVKRQGATLEVLDQPMDCDTLSGKMLFGFLSLMAEFETALRKERQREGILAAQKKGVHFGRAKMLRPAQVEELRQLRAAGVPVADLRKRYGMTRTSIYRYLAQARQPTGEVSEAAD